MPERCNKRKFNSQDVRFALERSHRYFRMFLGLIGVSYLALVVWRLSVPSVTSASAIDEGSSLVDGLVPTGDVANDARAFLNAAKRDQLIVSKGMRSTGVTSPPVESQPHPLLGKSAPNFILQNEASQTRSLTELNGKGPVVVVFYYGYHCSHCVAQLFALNDEIQRFRDQGIEVVAISPDSSEETARKFAQYGKFDFTVLSDSNNAVAQQYGAYQPRDEKNDEIQQHGTFLINRQGQVIWAFVGHQPFLDNDSLRFRLAEDLALQAAK